MKRKWTLLMLLLTVMLVGCNKTDDLWDEVRDLQARLAKLEKQALNLNGNIAALQSLYKDGISISSVEAGDGVYTLTLSNGETLKVVQKMEETAYPMVGIDNEGYWTVGYGSAAPTRILVSGNPVKALSENGLTPQFRVNATTGHWEVRYKESEAYQEVKDTNDNPVVADGNAGQGSDRFFESVGKSADGKSFKMKLKDGTELSIPITTFSCVFDPAVTGVQKIDSKATKTFTIKLTNVDDMTLLAVPAGWTAELSVPVSNGATLTVTAPEVYSDVTTRATASNAKDISILATSSNLSTILKLQVEVIPGSRVVNYKALYDAGTDITVGDVAINKTNYPNVVELDGTNTDLAATITSAATKTVIFLSGTNAFNIDGAADYALSGKDIVLISKQSNPKSQIVIKKTVRVQNGSRLVLKDLIITNAGTADLFATTSTTQLPEGFYCEDCDLKEVKTRILCMNATTYKIKSIYFKNNKVEIMLDNQTLFHSFNAAAGSNDIENVTIDNNIWYSKSLMKGYIYNNNIAGAVSRSVSFCNNTVINIASQSTNSSVAAYILIDGTSGLTIKDNIGYSDDVLAAAIGSGGSSFYRTVQANQNIIISGNVVYGLLPAIAWNSYVFNSATKIGQNSIQAIPRYDKDPFAVKDFTNGIFTPIPELAGKGATLK